MKIKKNRLFSIILFFIILSAIIVHIRLKHYPKNSSKSYYYDFNQTKAKFYNMKIKQNNIIILPKNKIPLNSTVFLEVNVSSNIIGKIIEPSITINNLSTYFEPNSKGIRYINITSLKDESILKITTNRMKIDKKIKLIIFKNISLNNKKILIIAPHPDDAEISSFGLYSTYSKNTFILTITAGDAGSNNYHEVYQNDIDSSYFEKAKLRIINSNTVPLIGGVDINNTLNLGYFDSKLKLMYYNKNKNIPSKYTHLISTSKYRRFNISPYLKTLNTTKSNWYSLVKDLKTILIKFKPNIIITVYPKIDAHPDHKYSSIALFEAIQDLKMKNIKLFLYTNHFINSELYPFGPRFSSMTLPPLYKQKLVFDSIYSFTLTKNKQREKILALEAMNDLRLNTEWTSIKGSFKWSFENLIKYKILHKSKTYFERSVKRDEIFFVIDSNKIKYILKGF